MMKIFIKAVLLFYVLPFSVFADTSLKLDITISAQNKTILTIAVAEDGYFPYHYSENGERKGLSIDLLDYYKANSKYDFEFLTLPWPRALYLVEHSKVDLILTLFKTPKREQLYHFIEPPFSNEANQLFTLVDNKFEFTGQLQQLTPLSIGTVRDYSYGVPFDEASYLN